MMIHTNFVLVRETLKHSIVHKPLLDYLLMASEDGRVEMIEMIRERLVELLHTKEGSRVAMHCVWYGTTKVANVCLCVCVRVCVYCEYHVQKMFLVL